MNELQSMNQAKTIMIDVNDNDNDNAISCSVACGSCSVVLRGWVTAPPLTQAGGACVYIESAPHAGVCNKAPHPDWLNKA